tara:strand:- start:732 stop:941 length:210 start_codon:yes stop_codon:yes gene_type:complete
MNNSQQFIKRVKDSLDKKDVNLYGSYIHLIREGGYEKSFQAYLNMMNGAVKMDAETLYQMADAFDIKIN